MLHRIVGAAISFFSPVHSLTCVVFVYLFLIVLATVCTVQHCILGSYEPYNRRVSEL